MKSYGKTDENFKGQGDNTGECYIPLDFNTVAPLLQRKPINSFTICEDSLLKLFDILKTQLSDSDKNKDLLVLMRIKKSIDMDSEKASKIGWEISNLMDKESLVVWAAQEYDTNRFDFYFYDSVVNS
tara:strand:+ start:3674 stop:4054 length:381 start_codon:yes stop_codon:yes gene_type:complete